MSGERLDRAAVAERYGIKPDSVNHAIRRGSLPPADGYFGRTPYWWSTTLDNWTRPKRGPQKKETSS